MDEARLVELLTQAFERLGLTGSFRDFREELEESTEALTDEEKARRIQEKLVKRTTEELDRLEKSLSKGRKKYVDLGATIQSLDEQLEEIDEGYEKYELSIRRNVLATQFLTAQYKKAGAEFLKTTADILINGAIKGTKTFVSGLQNGSSGVQVASDLMINALDVGQQQMAAVGNAMNQAGTVGMMVATTTQGKVLAGAFSLLGQTTSYLADKTFELAKFQFEVLSKEAEKTIKSFNDTSAAGAMFADGMTGLRNAAYDSGFTVEQWSNIVKNNSQALADTGLSVTEAAMRLGKVNKVLKSEKIDEQLLKLGFGFEEQAELIAETMSSMRRSGVLATASDDDIASATKNYAENLRTIANITGEDAKAALKEAEAKNRQYAVDAKIREIAAKTGKDPAKVKQDIDALFATLTKAGIETTGLMQQLATSTSEFGGVNAEAKDHIAGLSDALGPVFQKLNRGETDLTDVLTTLKSGLGNAATETNKLGQTIGTGALYVGGNLTDIAKTYEGIRQLDTLLGDPEKIKKSIENREKETDAATAEFIKLEREMQEARLKVERELTGHLSRFADVSNTLVEKMMETLGKIPGGRTDYGGGYGREIIEGTSTAIGTVIGGGLGFIGGLGFGAAPGAMGGAVAGNYIGSTIADLTGFSDGGIASGPVSGYQATLHGTEAVVPLPDGETIPVQIKSNNQHTEQLIGSLKDSIDRAMMPQYALLKEIADKLEKGNQISTGIMRNTA